MSFLQIEPNYVALPDDFTWGDDWVAETMWKEILPSGKEVLYAFCRRIYDKKTLDVGTLKEDEIYIGRRIVYQSKPKRDMNPKSKSFGQRTRPEIQYDEHQEWNPELGVYETKKIPRNVEKRFEHVHESTEEFIKHYKTLVGQSGPDKYTQFVFVQGSHLVTIPDKKTFFEAKVKDFMESEKRKDPNYVLPTKP